MKTIKKYIKLLSIGCFLVNANLIMAQPICATSFTAFAGANGSYTFVSNAVSSSSINPTLSYWNFGNGSTYSVAFSTAASTTFTANGTYTINLVSLNSSPTCSTSLTQTIAVTSVNIPTCNLIANFSYTLGGNGSALFLSTSTGATGNTNYYWNFGDGTFGSNASASHNYVNGTYTVVLMVADSIGSFGCINSSTQVITINSSTVISIPCNLSASFTYTQGANGSVFFTNTSTGITSGTNYFWDFGDSTYGYTSSSPHTYANGNYMVSLTVVDSTGSQICTDIATQTITVNSNTNTCSLNANFTSSPGIGNSLNFYNTSTGTSSNTVYNWDFGDGGSSTLLNPIHTYTTGGSYTAILYVYDSNNPSCNDSIVQVLSVGSSSCIANANFSLSPTNTPQIWNAFLANPLNIVLANWSWGDGSTSNTLYTSHTYSVAGVYNICLTVTVSCGAVDTVCATYSIYKMTGEANDMSIIQVNVVDPSTVGVKNITTETINYSISPNPNNGAFNISSRGLNSKNVIVAIYNMIGDLIYQTSNEIDNGNLIKDIQLNDLSNGVYFVKVAADNKVTTKKIIINK
jgi:PKD repeat protein